MSRTPQHPRPDSMPEPTHEDFVAQLRESARPLPATLRRRLLAIPVRQDDPVEIDRLYGAALASADAPSPADPRQPAIRTSATRMLVIELLAAVFRDARVPLPLPLPLVGALRRLGRGSQRPTWQVRWITQPRWAAAACWFLAFALTFGTGDAVAGLLDAPATLQTRSATWLQRAETTASELARAGWTATRATATAGMDLLSSRVVAAGVTLEAWTERLLVESARAGNVLAGPVLPDPTPPPPVSESPAAATSNEPLHQEDRDVR